MENIRPDIRLDIWPDIRPDIWLDIQPDTPARHPAGQSGRIGTPARPRHARDTEAYVGAKNIDFPLVFQAKVVRDTNQHGPRHEPTWVQNVQ